MELGNDEPVPILASTDSGDSQVDSHPENRVADPASTGNFSEPSQQEKDDRAARRKRHVKLFCFSCNRYEGHSVAARSRLLYSFLVGCSFGLYYYFGRYSCHCCGSVRLARNDWLNPRFWYRVVWLGGVVTPKSSKSKSRSRRKG